MVFSAFLFFFCDTREEAVVVWEEGKSRLCFGLGRDVCWGSGFSQFGQKPGQQ
jgi:hypothetical protein